VDWKILFECCNRGAILFLTIKQKDDWICAL
jgi:hypothetical protein